MQGAQKTLDLQYYAIHADASTGRDALVMRLAFEPNIEMRMFNPLAGARASTLGRLVNSLDDASRIQQRMHNKLFIADNVLAVSGGRNLGDA